MTDSFLIHALKVYGYKYASTDYRNGKSTVHIKNNSNALTCSACGSKNVLRRGTVDYLPQLMQAELKKPGVFQLPGLIKIQKMSVPKQPAIKNWKNPFTGEIMTKPAKPASTKIKLRPLKKLKDMA